MKMRYYALTDNGIDFGDTYVNTYVASKERIVEIAREAQRLYACELFGEFHEHVRDPGGFDYNHPWTDEVLEIIDNIIITDRGDTIYELSKGYNHSKKGKSEAIQEWKDNGIDAYLLSAYSVYADAKNEALKRLCQLQQKPVWVPFKHGVLMFMGNQSKSPSFRNILAKNMTYCWSYVLARYTIM